MTFEPHDTPAICSSMYRHNLFLVYCHTHPIWPQPGGYYYILKWWRLWVRSLKADVRCPCCDAIQLQWSSKWFRSALLVQLWLKRWAAGSGEDKLLSPAPITQKVHKTNLNLALCTLDQTLSEWVRYKPSCCCHLLVIPCTTTRQDRGTRGKKLLLTQVALFNSELKAS